MGVLARMHFTNPILGREVRACFRPRSTSIAMFLLAILLTPLAILAYILGIYWVIAEPLVREAIGGSLLGLFLIMTILLCALLSASSLSREREGNTWEALRLSLLSPREVLWGKMATPLILCAICGLVFLPILLLCVRRVEFVGNNQTDLSLTQLLAASVLIAACAWCFTLVGLLISQFSKRSVTAICGTLGVLFFLLVVPPVYTNSFGIDNSDYYLRQWHPFIALINVFDRQEKYYDDYSYDYVIHSLPTSTIGNTLPCAGLLILFGCVCYLVLWHKLFSSKKTEAR